MKYPQKTSHLTLYGTTGTEINIHEVTRLWNLFTEVHFL